MILKLRNVDPPVKSVQMREQINNQVVYPSRIWRGRGSFKVVRQNSENVKCHKRMDRRIDMHAER